MINIGTFLKTYKVGDIVDIVANSAQQRGMPHKVRLVHASFSPRFLADVCAFYHELRYFDEINSTTR
jgi:hypothetical protein